MPADDFEEDVVEEPDDLVEEEGQSEPEENDSQPESGQEIISKDVDNYDDDGVQDAGKLLLREINPCIAFHPNCQRRRKKADACSFWRCGTTLSFLPHIYYICLIRAMFRVFSPFQKR